MSSIGSIGSSTLMQSMQSARSMKRPDPTQMAENLFSRLDTSGQGYIQKSDLQAAFDKISTSSSSSASGTTANVDDLFSKLDSDADGKVTKQEFSDVLAQVSEQLDNQAMSLRMNGGMPSGGMGGGMSGMGGMGGMPPPPPPSDDAGFTEDELSSQLEEIGASDSERSTLISNILDNFDAADTDDDGKVSFKEAMAFDQSGSSSSSASSASGTASSGTSSTGSSDTSADAKVMLQIMRLMQAYAIGADAGATTGTSLSVAA